MPRKKKHYEKFYLDHNGIMHHGYATKSSKQGYFVCMFRSHPEKEIVIHDRFLYDDIFQAESALKRFWQEKKNQAADGIKVARLWRREFMNSNCLA